MRHVYTTVSYDIVDIKLKKLEKKEKKKKNYSS